VVVAADPILDYGTGVLKSFEAMAMDALVLERSDDALDHAILPRRARRDELLPQPIALNQGHIATAGVDQPVGGYITVLRQPSAIFSNNLDSSDLEEFRSACLRTTACRQLLRWYGSFHPSPCRRFA
jgi:hypothetical protein